MVSARTRRMEKWLNFCRCGDRIGDSRFVAFKVPIVSDSFNIPVEARFTFTDIFRAYPNIGLIIDLTATTRYYNPEIVLSFGCMYKKISIQGHGTLPSNEAIQCFNSTVDYFLQQNSQKLIGVHCTHGVNRTGFLICQYLISRYGMSARDAIDKFTAGRHHLIERRNYLQALFKLEYDLLRYQQTDSRYYPANLIPYRR